MDSKAPVSKISDSSTSHSQFSLSPQKPSSTSMDDVPAGARIGEMNFSRFRRNSPEECKAAIYTYANAHQVSQIQARSVLMKVPAEICNFYYPKNFELQYPARGFKHLAAGERLCVPSEVGDSEGPQMSLEEWMSRKPRYAEKPEKENIPAIETHECSEMDVSEMVLANTENYVYQRNDTTHFDPFPSRLDAPNENEGPSFWLPPVASSCTSYAPPLSEPPPPTVGEDESVFAPVYEEPTTSSKTRKFEETTVFTKAARKEMSDFWFHGSVLVNDANEDDVEDDITCSSVIPKRQPQAEAVAFQIHEDDKTRDILNQENIVPPAPPVFSVFEDDTVNAKIPPPTTFQIYHDPDTSSVFVPPSASKQPKQVLVEVPRSAVVVEEVPASDKTWAPDEDFTLGFVNDRTRFSKVAEDRRLQSTPKGKNPVEAQPQQPDSDTTDFKKPVSILKRPPRKSYANPMTPVVESSREFQVSVNSTASKSGGMSRYYSSSSAGSSETQQDADVRLNEMSAISEVTEVTMADTVGTLTFKLQTNAFNERVKFRLAELLGVGPSSEDYVNIVNIPDSSWDTVVVGSKMMLKDGDYSVEGIWELKKTCTLDMTVASEAINAMVTVSKKGPWKMVRLMEPLSEWELRCWVEYMKRSGRPLPSGILLKNNAIVEIKQCGPIACNSFASIVERYCSLGETLPDQFILALIWNLVLLVEEFHSCNMIIGNFSPENLFVLGIPCFMKDIPSTVMVADLSSVIDMAAVPKDLTFKTEDLASGDVRNQLAEFSEWTYELDYIGIVKTLCFMLFPKDKFVTWNEGGKVASFYPLGRRFAFRHLWEEIATILLNSSPRDNPLERVKKRISEGREINVSPDANQLRDFESSLKL